MSDVRMIDTTVYLQIERDPRWTWQGVVRRATKKKPDPPLGGAVTVKLTIRIPASSFEPLQPEAVIVVPESLVTQPIEVEAVDPS